MNRITPKTIKAPSGATARPQLKTYRVGNEEITEAHYIDPNTGTFFYKGVVSVEKINTSPKTIDSKKR